MILEKEIVKLKEKINNFLIRYEYEITQNRFSM